LGRIHGSPNFPNNSVKLMRRRSYSPSSPLLSPPPSTVLVPVIVPLRDAWNLFTCANPGAVSWSIDDSNTAARLGTNLRKKESHTYISIQHRAHSTRTLHIHTHTHTHTVHTSTQHAKVSPSLFFSLLFSPALRTGHGLPPPAALSLNNLSTPVNNLLTYGTWTSSTCCSRSHTRSRGSDPMSL
jgi:hypothetical protein